MKPERYLFEPKPRMEIKELVLCILVAASICALLVVALESLALQNDRLAAQDKLEDTTF